jgi:hypothetical protein
MRSWMNKKTGQVVLATEQWEPLQVEHDEKFYESILPEFKDFTGGRKVVRGLLLQVGWLIQNEHGVWFGMPLSITDYFEDLGDA